jgi:hypothetical protein
MSLFNRPKLRIKNLNVEVHEHGGFTNTVTVRVSVIGLKKEDLLDTDQDTLSKNILDAAVKHLEASYQIEMVKP